MECSHFLHSSHGDAVMHHTELQGRFVVAASSTVDTAPLPVAHLPPANSANLACTGLAVPRGPGGAVAYFAR